MSNKCNYQDAFKDGLPISIGFIPIAMAFGILAKSVNLTLLESVSFSMIVFAGASQFIALSLLAAGVKYSQIILTTFLVNFRHFLFASFLSQKTTKEMKKATPLIAFGLTDEIFSVASLKQKELTTEYLLLLEFCAYSSLAIGTLLGYLLGGLLPQIVQQSTGIALYALFIALLTPELKRSKKIIILVILAGLINSLLTYFLNFTQGWNLIITIMIVSTIGLFFNDNKKEN